VAEDVLKGQAYSALGCNLLFGLVLLALMAFVVFGLGGAPLPR